MFLSILYEITWRQHQIIFVIFQITEQNKNAHYHWQNTNWKKEKKENQLVDVQDEKYTSERGGT